MKVARMEESIVGTTTVSEFNSLSSWSARRTGERASFVDGHLRVPRVI